MVEVGYRPPNLNSHVIINGDREKESSRWAVSLDHIRSLNPKSIAFFVAFLPQFVTSMSPTLPQLAILGGTFLFLAGVNAVLYALFAGQLRDRPQSPKMQCWFAVAGPAPCSVRVS